MKLLAKALDTMAFFWDRRIAVIHVTKKMLEEAEALWEYTEGFVEFPRSIEGVEVGRLHQRDRRSPFQSQPPLPGSMDVEKIAGVFGGGGASQAPRGMQNHRDLESVESKARGGGYQRCN